MEDRPVNDISFEQFLAEEKLMGSKCKACGALFVPPRPICIHCGSSEMEWFQAKGRGKLAAFTCIAIGPPCMREQGYGRKNPYCTGVIQLEDGPRGVARIEEVDATSPDRIKIGMPLSVKFLHRGEGADRKTTLAFKPA